MNYYAFELALVALHLGALVVVVWLMRGVVVRAALSVARHRPEHARAARAPMAYARNPERARVMLIGRLESWPVEELRRRRGECIELIDVVCREEK